MQLKCHLNCIQPQTECVTSQIHNTKGSYWGLGLAAGAQKARGTFCIQTSHPPAAETIPSVGKAAGERDSLLSAGGTGVLWGCLSTSLQLWTLNIMLSPRPVWSQCLQFSGIQLDGSSPHTCKFVFQRCFLATSDEDSQKWLKKKRHPETFRPLSSSVKGKVLWNSQATLTAQTAIFNSCHCLSNLQNGFNKNCSVTATP